MLVFVIFETAHCRTLETNSSIKKSASLIMLIHNLIIFFFSSIYIGVVESVHTVLASHCRAQERVVQYRVSIVGALGHLVQSHVVMA